MTRATAESRLAERGLHLRESGGTWLILTTTNRLISFGPTWQWAYAEATGEPPF